jgi:hypothetical protein
VVDAGGHAKAVQFDFMQPLRPGRRFLDRQGKLRRNEARKGRVALASARRTGLESLRARTLDDTRHDANLTLALLLLLPLLLEFVEPENIFVWAAAFTVCHNAALL